MMKRIILSVALATIVLSLTGCENTCEEMGRSVTNEALLTINAVPVYDAVVPTRTTISVFPDQAELGLFVTSGTLGNDYNNIAANSNVKSTLTGSVWNQTPAVYLSSAAATVFAYYPYSNDITDGTNVAVEHGSQTDYLYGMQNAGQSAINNANSNVNIGMHHALAMIQFQFSRRNYTGPGKLMRIEIFNNSGTLLCSDGTMNVATGEITNIVGKSASAVIENISEGLIASIPATALTDDTTFPKVLVLPLKKETAAGNISIRFMIDGLNYTWGVPAATRWEKGTKYTYKIELSGTEVRVGAISITNWIVGAIESAGIK